MTVSMATSIFSSAELSDLSPKIIPKHVAIICDGNRRWAKQAQEVYKKGHEHGADVVLDVVKAAKEIGIKVITLWAFSTENWKRSEEEVQCLFSIMNNYLKKQEQAMIANGVRLDVIGDTKGLPESLQESIKTCKAATSHCSEITLVLAINYGGRNDICRAVQTLISQNTPVEKVTEDAISKLIDTAQWGDPQLFIRPSGEKRHSNFLLWQLYYGEMYFTDTLWPDFSPHELLKAVMEYQHRIKRYGS
jgi:undecaprenyl diphosphate synthase